MSIDHKCNHFYDYSSPPSIPLLLLVKLAQSRPGCIDPSPAPHCCIESKWSLSLRVMLGIRLTWSSTQLPTQRSISERTAGSLAPESKRSFALSLQCIVHLVSRSWGGRDAIKYAINRNIEKKLQVGGAMKCFFPIVWITQLLTVRQGLHRCKN